MARTKKGTPPSYPSKPHKGQARITIRQANGKRREIDLGPYGSPESRKEYQRVLAELEAAGGYHPVREDGKVRSDLTVAELLKRFWAHAEDYYRLADSSPSRERDHYKWALGPVLDLYADTPAREFGPLALKAVRQRMLDARQYQVRAVDPPGAARCVGEARVKPGEGLALLDKGKEWVRVEVLASRQALSRKVINQRIEHVKRVWRWAVEEELVLPQVYDALKELRAAPVLSGRRLTRD